MLKTMNSEEINAFKKVQMPFIFKELFENGYPYDCNYSKEVKAAIGALRNDTIEDQGLSIVGPFGSKKTSIACAIGIQFFLTVSKSLFFTRSIEMVKRIRDKENKDDDNNYEHYYRAIPKLLIIDGLGKERKEEAHTVYDIIEARSFRKLKTIITTDLNEEDFKNHYGDRLLDFVSRKYLRIDTRGKE